MSVAALAPWILTVSGRRFDLLAPTVDSIDAGDIAHALSQVNRFGGHTRVPYSVAEHSLLVSRIVPVGFALAGLLHDAAEAYVGDVVGPLACRLPAFLEIEARILDAVAIRFSVPRSLFHSPEVRRADRVALLTERRDLLPPSPEPWAEDILGIEPDAHRIRPVQPQIARDMFLERLVDLTAGGRVGAVA